ncbi:hypothetical protein U1Q18_052428 [Sarracenia purpurea var. burkii]
MVRLEKLNQLCADRGEMIHRRRSRRGPINHNQSQSSQWGKAPMGSHLEVLSVTGSSSSGRYQSSLNIFHPTKDRPSSSGSPTIFFTDRDAQLVQQPHDDPLVISLMIGGHTVRRVLVDTESFVEVLFVGAFDQIQIGRDKLQPVNIPFIG